MIRGELEPGKTARGVGRAGTILETPTRGKPGNCINVLARFQREVESLFEKMNTGLGNGAWRTDRVGKEQGVPP